MKYLSVPNRNAFITIVLVVSLFVGATMLSQVYAVELKNYLASSGWQSMIIYIFATAFGTVLAPVSTVTMIPLVAQSWGWVVTGMLSVVGWVIGSQIAFVLARQYGTSLVSRFISLEKIRRYESKFSSRHLFWTVVVLRMLVPVDVLSYALGLFSTMSAWSYLIATTIGVVPFAFIFSYTGTLSPGLQIIILVELALLLVVIYYIKRWFTRQ